MRRRKTFTERLAFSYLVVIGVTVFFLMAYFYSVLSARNMTLIDTTIRTYATELSLSPQVKDFFLEGADSEEIAEYLDHIISEEEYIDYIVLADTNSIRLYHPDRNLVGQHFQGGDEGPAVSGEGPYVTEGKGSQEFQRRCFCTVYDDRNSILGFIMVSCYTKSIRLLKQMEFFKLLTYLFYSLCIGAILARMTANSLKHRLLGYEPAHIAELFQQREDVLNSLNEGLILVDDNWKYEYMNIPAVRLLTGKDMCSKEELQSIVENDIHLLVRDVPTDNQFQIKHNDTVLMVDLGPISHNDKQIGTLILLNDMTRLQRLAEELTGVKHIIDALRATTHEQKNRLHVILGLLQLGETSEAMNYISDTVQYESKNSQILNSIENKTVAALILGKMNKARELDIELELVKDSFLVAHNDYLSTEDMVTIIGNLIENAFDALANADRGKRVDLFIKCSDEGLVVIVDDNGEGMSEETKEKIMTGSFTTKGEGHGTGLRLIRTIVSRSNGFLNIESEPGEGSSFTVMIYEKRKRS